MIKKSSVFGLLCMSAVGLGAMQVHAATQVANIHSMTFPFSGTCSGQNNIIGTPAITSFVGAPGTTPTSATITLANITITQQPTGLQYAYLSISGDNSDDLAWVGTNGASVTTGVGAAGSFFTGGVLTTLGNGVTLPLNGGLNLTLACASGTWQAFATIWYHAP